MHDFFKEKDPLQNIVYTLHQTGLNEFKGPSESAVFRPACILCVYIHSKLCLKITVWSNICTNHGTNIVVPLYIKLWVYVVNSEVII